MVDWILSYYKTEVLNPIASDCERSYLEIVFVDTIKL